MRVDVDKAQDVQKELKRREDVLLEEVEKETGVLVEPWAAASIAKAFDALGLNYNRTEKIECASLYKSISCEPHSPGGAEDCTPARV